MFTFSPKNASSNPSLQFLGSILTQRDVQAIYYVHPQVNHSPSNKQILEVRNSRPLGNTSEISHFEKPPLSNQIKLTKERGTPQARTPPLSKTPAITKSLPKQSNTNPYIPLKLPDENHY